MIRGRGAVRVGASLVVVALGVGACRDGATATLTPSAFNQIGRIDRAEIRGDVATYVLAGGDTVELDLSTVRQIARGGGSPRLLIVGSDATGQWMAEVGTQDGLPDECHILNQVGIDADWAIGIGGVLWPKAPAFDAGGVAKGQAYASGTRFCLDDGARVSKAIGP